MKQLRLLALLPIVCAASVLAQSNTDLLTDGRNPEGDMLLHKGSLYSTTTGGGDPGCGCGVIYEITAKGKQKVLEAFTADSGNEYSAGLTLSDGVFYGTTQNGANDDNGVVFSLTK